MMVPSKNVVGIPLWQTGWLNLSLCTSHISSATPSHVIPRNILMTLQLLVVSVMDKRLSTGN